ncbi:MAG: aminotransferase class V-fold PLP-dependent enzyme [Thermomicrobiales bacterium]
MIYLDNAATSWPKPLQVYQTLATFLQRAGANPGRASHRMAVDAATALLETRASIARLINAERPEQIVFSLNATDALNLAIRGLIRLGDRVITTSMEHNSVTRPLRAMADLGAEVVKVRASFDGVIDVNCLCRAAQKNVRLIAITHASNVNGAIQPIAEIAEIAREVGAYLLVDGAQTVGAMPVDVQALGIDLLAFPGHKALMGPPGTGGLYISPRVDLGEFEPQRAGGTGFNSEEEVQPCSLPERYESGTNNTVGIAALGAGVEFILDQGVDAIWEHDRSLVQQLTDGFSMIDGVHVVPSGSGCQTAAVVSFTIDGWQPADVGAALDQSFDIACRTGLHCAPDSCRTLGVFPTGTVRFSPGFFTTPEDVDTAIAAIAEIAGSPLS